MQQGHETHSDFASGLQQREKLDSPERVQLDLELAGPMSRAFAYSIDYSIVLVLMMGLLFLMVSGMQQILEWASQWDLVRDLIDSLTRISNDELFEPDSTFLRGIALAIGIYMILELGLTTLYFVFFETLLSGRTLGKRLTGLRVVSTSGARVGWRASLLRNLLRTVDVLPSGYLVGLVAMIASPRAQRLGDLAAGTLVIRERRLAEGEVFQHRPVDTDIEAGFRFRSEELALIGEAERHLIRRTLRRAEAVSRNEAESIVSRTADAICTRIGREATLAPEAQVDFLAALLQASERLI